MHITISEFLMIIPEKLCFANKQKVKTNILLNFC